MVWHLLLSTAALAADGNFIPHETTLFDRATSFFGIFVILGIAWLSSEKRSHINWRPVIFGIVMQIVMGLIVLSPSVSAFFYTVVDGGVHKLLSFAESGATFVFQSIEAHDVVVGSPGELASGGGTHKVIIGSVSPAVKTFAFWILPTIVFFSALMSLLYHVGLMTAVVRVMAWLMMRTLGTSGAESLSAAANIFVGQTEAPLLVKPFVSDMTRSELMAVMVGGFATVSGGVMGAYVQFLDGVPNIAGHLVIASLMSAPAALACAKILLPETEHSKTAGDVEIEFQKTASNAVEAAAMGAADGMKLAINVAAMLMAFVGLVAMIDWFVSFVPVTHCADGWSAGYACVAGDAGKPLSMADIFGVVFSPLAAAMGVPFRDCLAVGRLLGEKMVLTEFIAFISLGEMAHAAEPVITSRAAIISSYGLCGFANFASIGIQLGGIGGMAPERMKDLAGIGFRAMWGGMLAACLTGAVAGLML
ncbi:MAG: NupC/NupG family nucleoside CNT transporter [Alphaproteobacteria bacterium]|nr:NupC/NupG family nucleoside CNT transporter [Alphaproteobacteria bacterium]MCB9696307.1 NupC/NupG family nucleoside CNT transporter [Alphaproteobacteria bacterium]